MMDRREWRAVALGWLVAIIVAMLLGVHYLVPVAATGTAVLVWSMWQD